ncbi:MAG TPA: spore gernimation protein [Lysinibacillus sp.]|jgi:spore germination protein (amino acid permease)|uniref:Spore gernimation protein n=1 Tax=Lysinibacillus fusiformis TaxID=28031 RepID=A0A2I0V0F9_9BACI|nr:MULTISPECIES: endospore germination permease [Lysinibacillus]HBT72467.1 spore gernimation protein [Lysinibacillus sp.]KUF32020.1 spore gernimation protein [Lysinibacillus sp. F5]MEE3806230.1 endospore germination permease [Lysinibacillus fusiformis]PKU51749.1 spore gernimation protein [Lysinibacillus fusiformis]WCH46030.1 endospore germination permease [Lysinibacillus sp. OF-1]
MKGVGSISILHVIFLSMTVIGLKNHVTIIPPLLDVAKRDGWLSVLLAGGVIFFWLFLLVYIQSKSKQEPIRDWLNEKIGNIGSSIVIYTIVIFIMIITAFTMVETLQWVNTTFLPQTPVIILLFIYTILCILLVTTSLQTIVILNVFVLFGVVVFGFFVAFTNLQVKDYDLLRPFFEHGFQPVFRGMIFPASGFIELLMLLFLQHQFKERIRWYHFVIMLSILVGLTLGPLIGAITEFGPSEAAKQRYPAYEEWGLVTIGRYIEHLDFFSIYQWLTGTFIRVSFLLYIVADLLKMTGNPKRIWQMLAPPFFILCLPLIMLNENLFLKVKGNYILTSTFIFFFALSIFFVIVAFLSDKSSKKGKTEKQDMKSGES